MSAIMELERSVAEATRNLDTSDGLKLLAELQDAVARLPRKERIARVRRLLADAYRVLDEAKSFAQYDGVGTGRQARKVTGVVTLFSGGNDSTTLAHIFKKHVTHIGMANTGIGIEQTRQYVRATAASWGIPLIEKHPEPGYGYKELVLGQCRAKTGPNKGAVLWPGGFPGPAAHSMMYQRLKERAFEQIRNDLVTNPLRERVIFLGGRRATESNRRKTLAFKGAISRKGSTVWCAPLINWTKMDLNTYRLMYPSVPRNEVSDLIHMSGECLCGAFAHENELDEIGDWFPEMRTEIEQLEQLVARAKPKGVEQNPRCSRWGWDTREAVDSIACECKVA